MAFFAIFTDTIRHAWRLKLPVALCVSILILISALPTILKSDGTYAGSLKLFFLYSGQVQVFFLCVLATGWSIWMEKYERSQKVHIMIASRPIGRGKVLLARAFASLFICLFFLGALNIVIGIIAYDIEEKSREKDSESALSQFLEVRSKEALTPLNRNRHKKDIFVTGLKKNAYTLEHGDTLTFDLKLNKLNSDYQLSGSLATQASKTMAILEVTLAKDKNDFWQRRIEIQPNKDFVINLPSAIQKLSPLSLKIKQVNEKKKAFYYLQSKPIYITNYYGTIWPNLFRGAATLLIKGILLIFISIAAAQFLSTPGSAFTTITVYIIGFFKEDIRNMLFPPLRSFQEQNILTNLNPVELFYIIVWKPILFFIPDFSLLNPTARIVNGELISWSELGFNFMSVIPFITIISIYLFYFIPNQELARDL